jgi:hypothetical protein
MRRHIVGVGTDFALEGRMRRRMIRAMVVMTMAAALVGCGESRGTRAVTGGLLGAGGGAAVGSMTGLGAGKGALIGGGVGAAGGALTGH